jgi:hypothetical protein
MKETGKNGTPGTLSNIEWPRIGETRTIGDALIGVAHGNQNAEITNE